MGLESKWKMRSSAALLALLALRGLCAPCVAFRAGTLPCLLRARGASLASPARRPLAHGLLPARATGRARLPRLAATVADGAEEGGDAKPYRVIDDKMDHTVVMPIAEETASRDIECKITKSCLFLSVGGKRVIDGELWGEVVADDSYWEIDEYGKDDRCIVVRLKKKAKEDWPFVIRGDYDLTAADWADRRVVSRATVSKEDVEGALQLIVSLLKPSGLSPVSAAPEELAPQSETLPGEQPLKTLPKAPGSDEMQKKWEKIVAETKEEEWRDTTDAMSKAFSDGRSPDEIQDLLSVTQQALQGGPGSMEVELAPVAGIVFVRHSSADKAQGDSEEEDLMRALTEEGRVLATTSRRWFSTLVNADRQPFGVSFSSCAGRCVESAYLMGAPKPVILDGLYAGTMEADARAAFAELGYAPLADYVRAGHGGILRRYAERAVVELADALEEEIKTQSAGEGGDHKVSPYLGTVAVFGHSVYAASVAMLIAQALRLKKEHTSTIATLMHGESEAFIVTPGGAGLGMLVLAASPAQRAAC